MKKSIISLFSVFVMTILFSANSWAHAVLEKTSPVDNTVLASTPENILLIFDEPVELIQYRLTSKNGDDIPLQMDNIVNSREQVEIVLPTLTPGRYAFHWGVISKDGHPVNGILQFEITG